jgi:NADP-dependent 3-hydroxy acid dehydrogenase YdfG
LSLCVGLEEKENGIRCTALIPGEVDTPILDQRPVPVSVEQRKTILQPEDVAAAALFVAALPPRVNVPELVIVPAAQAWA